MKIRKAFKFKIKTKNKTILNKLAQNAGCQRFVWNKALAFKKETYEQTNKSQNYSELCKIATQWKKEDETSFLKEVHSQPLQQTLKDLDKAYKDFLKKNKAFPKFKKKGMHDSFRFPQGVKVEGSNVYFPKIGKVRFVKTRDIVGEIKNTTVSKSCGKWFVSFQVEYEVDDPVHSSKQIVGLDLGIAKFATLSNGNIYHGTNSLRGFESKLAKEQKKLSRKSKFSNNWKKQKEVISKIHSKIANIRKDRLHWVSNIISKNHVMIGLENLKVSNMSKSSKGTIEDHGKNVKAKSGLNKSILDQGWFEFKRQLEYKELWRGGQVILVPAHYTSQICSKCGYKDSENRKTQSKFECIKCGHTENADINAAKNILKRAVGQTVSACGDISSIAS